MEKMQHLKNLAGYSCFAGGSIEAADTMRDIGVAGENGEGYNSQLYSERYRGLKNLTVNSHGDQFRLAARD